MFLPVHPNKFRTVDAIHKLGSYPVPREGRDVATMDKITTQELAGAIVFETATNTPSRARNKYLGFILDQIFSDAAAIDTTPLDKLVVPPRTISKFNPSVIEMHPNSLEIPLYDMSAEKWNWPILKATSPPRDSKGGSQEHHLAAFFNAIALAMRPAVRAQASNLDLQKPTIAERYWLGTYSTRRMPGNADGAGAYCRKPDIILIEKADTPTDSISWMSPKVIAECTNQAWKPSMPLMKTLHTKAYLVFLDQPWRCFVLALSIVKEKMRVHFYDRSGGSVSPPINIQHDPRAFVAVLATIMFSSPLCIGFDPTITVRPVQPLRVSRRKVIYESTRTNVPDAIPEESGDDHDPSSHPESSTSTPPDSLPNYVDVISSQSTSPTFLLPSEASLNISLTGSAPDSDTPAGPIGEIRVRSVIYEILEVLFSSAGFLGRGTVIYLARREGRLYIIKDHWVENPSQEASMMKLMEGTRGVPRLIDHWVVEVSPGVVDITSRYRSERHQTFMKGMRTHVRTVMSPRGCPLSKFRTKYELVKCIKDVLIGRWTSFSREDIQVNIQISSKGSSSKRDPSS